MTDELENGVHSDTVNPGELLRIERERVGFSTEEVAALLHLSKNTLGYLEAGNFDRLPGDTFTRGYIRSYARLLKLDPNTFAGYFDRYVGVDSRDARVGSINRVDAAPCRITRWVMASSTVLIIAAMLVLGLWWWNDSRDASLPAESDDIRVLIDDVQVDAMALPESFTSPPVTELSALEEEPNLESESAAQIAQVEAPAPVAEAMATEDQLEVSANNASTALDETAATEPALDSGLIMAFSGNCWVQISVVGGRVLHSAQMQAGQTLNIDHQGPLDLVIGAADAVSIIEYNGQSVDLDANRQSGVARLRLGQ